MMDLTYLKQKESTDCAKTPIHFMENRFSSDYVIDAYLKGHNDGSGLNLTTLFKDSLQKLKNSIAIINQFYEKNLTDDSCISLYFKMSLPDKISFLFAIHDDTYFDSTKRKHLYEASSQSMKDNPFIYMSFIPCKNKSCINQESVLADDYIELK